MTSITGKVREGSWLEAAAGSENHGNWQDRWRVSIGAENMTMTVRYTKAAQKVYPQSVWGPTHV